MLQLRLYHTPSHWLTPLASLQVLVGDPRQLPATSELMDTHIPGHAGGTRDHLHFHTRSTMQRLSDAKTLGASGGGGGFGGVFGGGGGRGRGGRRAGGRPARGPFAAGGSRGAGLRAQYRMAPDICHVVDTHFYRQCAASTVPVDANA